MIQKNLVRFYWFFASLKKQLKTIFYHIANRNQFFLEILILIYFCFFHKICFIKNAKKQSWLS